MERLGGCGGMVGGERGVSEGPVVRRDGDEDI
jgi:hypothetical protein